MVIIRLMLLLLLVVSCGKQPSRYIDPQLAPYLTKFERDSTQEGVGTGDYARLTIVKFDSLQSNLAGVCIYHTENYGLFYHRVTKQIIISNTLKNDQKLYKILLHELGHCVYHLAHNSDPKSIMYAHEVDADLSEEPQFFHDALDNMHSWFDDNSP